MVTDLQTECDKIYHKDVNLISDLMHKTFSTRWTEVISGMPIHTLLTSFPGLKIQSELHNEFKRLMPSETKSEKELLENIHRHALATLYFAEQRKKKSEYLITCFKKLADYRDIKLNNDKEYSKKISISSLLVLPEFLDGDRSLAFVEYPNTASTADLIEGPPNPHIACVGTIQESSLFYLIIEGNILLNTEEFLEAVYSLFASYYVFNIEYPKKCLNFFSVSSVLFNEHNIEEKTTIKNYKCVG